ncbi:hypothetical protein ACIQMP_30660 [Streptomyces sp. NPDC091385]|uniref:hypothetical protein n=1 Tax=Streptomyces sp. NPDC091385 TaxID=3365997 RepID=UPI0038211DAE
MSITQQHLFDTYRARTRAAAEPPAFGTGVLALLRTVRDRRRFRAVLAGRPARGRWRAVLVGRSGRRPRTP